MEEEEKQWNKYKSNGDEKLVIWKVARFIKSIDQTNLIIG